MAGLVLGSAGGREILSEENATGKALKVGQVHLYTNDLDPTGNNVIADFNEATYNGYAAVAAVTWGTPYNGPQGQPMISAHIEIPCTDAVITETIKGYYVVLPAQVGPPAVAAKLLCAERFEAAQHIAKEGDSIVFDINFGLQALGTADLPS